MKYHQEIIVNIPFSKLLELFEDPKNLKKWQPDVISFTPISGTIGQVGAVSKMRVNMVIKELEITETIIKRNLPDEFVIQYQTPGVTNMVTNGFKELAPNQTRWIMQNDYKFGGIARFAVMPLKGIFKKQTQVTMERFKKFAESLPVDEQLS